MTNGCDASSVSVRQKWLISLDDLATERAVAVRHPRWSARRLYAHATAMTASVDGHGEL